MSNEDEKSWVCGIVVTRADRWDNVVSRWVCDRTFATRRAVGQHQNRMHRGPGGGVDPKLRRRWGRKAGAAGRRRQQELRETDPEWARRESEAKGKPKRTPEARQEMSERSHRLWADPEMQQRMNAPKRTRWEDPAFSERTKENMRRVRGTPDVRQRVSEHFTQYWAAPEAKQQKSEASRARWAKPKWKAKTRAAITASLQHPEVKQRLSDAQRRIWVSDPETKAKRLAAMAAGKARAKAERAAKREEPEP